MKITGSEPARGLAVAALIAFLGVLVLYLDQPGFSQSRLLLFTGMGGTATLGTAGAVAGRARIAAVSGVVLGLLGFWQAVLWVFALPMAGVLAAAAFLIVLDERTVERR